MSANPFDPKATASRRQRLWGAAVLLAIAVIALPLLLSGSGSESENKFRRVEKLREEPPIVVDRDGVSTTLPIPEDDQAIVSFDSVAGERDSGLVDADDASGVSGPTSAGYATADQRSEAGLSTGTDDGAATVRTATTRNVAEGSGSTAGVAGLADGIAGNLAAPATGNRSGRSGNSSDAQSGAIDTADAQIAARLDQNASESIASQQALTAWVVLAGAFVSEVDALGVRDRLRQAGFAAFVRDREANDKLFRVLVGPMIKEDAALDALEEVAALLDSNATVLSYP